jgi:adhesin/invasin
MKNFKSIIGPVFVSLVLVTSVYAINFEETVINKTLGKTNSFLSSVTNNLTENYLNTDRVKYLDIDLQVQDSLKPTFSLTNVNKISEDVNSVFFNQNTMSIHNNDQTVNFGLGYRNLINDDKVMLGVNLFLDYSFDDAHQRNGVGVEAISSVFDLRGNYYDATSGIQTLGDGSTEEALDGWDVRIDYHLPLEYDVNVFAGIFDFENAAGSFELKGEKYGLSGNAGNTNFEIGYVDDNKAGDGAFGNVTMVFDLGQPKRLSTTNGALEYVSVRDQLYTPVKRENKIRVVKVSALNIVVSGF